MKFDFYKIVVKRLLTKFNRQQGLKATAVQRLFL
jgi:hypothetical protein